MYPRARRDDGGRLGHQDTTLVVVHGAFGMVNGRGRRRLRDERIRVHDIRVLGAAARGVITVGSWLLLVTEDAPDVGRYSVHLGEQRTEALSIRLGEALAGDAVCVALGNERDDGLVC